MRSLIILFASLSVLLSASLLSASLLSATERTTEDWTNPDNHWIFEHTVRAESPLLDLSSLNAADVDPSGFIRATPEGGFQRADGSPIRFWSIGSGVWDEILRDQGGWYQAEQSTAADIEAHAEHLARVGVNMVRIHTHLYDNREGQALTAVDMGTIDKIHRFVSIMRRHGIYVTISPLWAHTTYVPESWQIAGYNSKASGSNTDFYGLLFFNPRLQEAYKGWLRALLTTPNPYHDNLPLGQDPAVAILQVHNEDSLFFWTSQAIRDPQKPILIDRWNSWLTTRYGSTAAALEAWDHYTVTGIESGWPADDTASGRLTLRTIWHLTQSIDPSTGQGKRYADQTEFFAGLMRGFYGEIKRFCHEELQAGQLVNGTNWQTASDVHLNDQERYSMGSGDVDAVNRYYSGRHDGPDNGWRIRTGDRYLNPSSLFRPQQLPTNIKQTVGRPMIVPETQWVTPLLYQSEGPFLTAAYMSLTGVDSSYFFNASDITYTPPHWPYGDGLKKWVIDTPSQMSVFPAAALFFRKGYLQQGAAVVHEERTLQQLWQRRSPIIAEGSGYDPNRDTGDIPADSGVASGIDPKAFLVGPVEVVHDGDPAKSSAQDLGPFIDATAGTIRSNTGEILFDHHRGLCTVDAPKVQGASGFLAEAGPIQLGTIRISSDNHYATVLAVALDDQPLASSTRILLQVVTVSRPEGYQAAWNHDQNALELTSRGQNRWAVENTRMSLRIGNSGLSRARLLDPAGYAVQDLVLNPAGAAFDLTLPATAMYVLIEGAGATTQAPAAPGSLAASASSSSSVALSWNDHSSDEAGFRIERAQDSGSFALLATVGAGVTSHGDSGLSAATTYHYRVRAHNSGGDSAWSNTATATTRDPAPTLPAAPGQLTATTASDTSVNLQWTDHSNDESGFRIERAVDGGSFAWLAEPGANATSFSDSGLVPGSTCTYRIRAQNAAGSSSWSNEASATTTSTGRGPYGGTPHAIPGTIQAEHFDDGGRNIAWYDASAGNNGGALRATDVDVENTSDTGGGHNVGWIDTGEWLEFTVEVGAAGPHRLEARVASGGGAGSCRVRFQGIDVTGAMAVPDTGGWQAWTTITSAGFELAAGRQVMRIEMPQGGFNLNWLRLIASEDPVSDRSIGGGGQTGSYAVDGEVITIAGSGADIWGRSDGFHYASQTISGDFVMEARVESMTDTHPWAKAGIMLRESLEPGSRHAFVCLTPRKGSAFQRRSSTDGSSSHTAGPLVQAPYWLRLERVGSRLTASGSADGVAWTVIRQISLDLPSQAQLGLAVTSHDVSKLCTAVFTTSTITPLSGN